MNQITIPAHNWRPRAYQRKLWRYLESGGRRALAVFHRRAGKDEVALHWTCVALHERPGTYWHMLPQASQARKAIWEAINPHTGRRRIDEVFPQELRDSTRENEMMIRFRCGSTWQVVGSDNFNALVGSPPIGIVFSEWSLADPASWAYLRPILRENGGWAIFIYTPRGRNHGLSLFQSAKQAQGWYHEVLSAEESGVFTAEQLADEKKELIAEYGEEMGQAYFEQEYLCSFDAANIGAVYARYIHQAEVSGRIVPLAHDPDYSVSTFWDFGFSDATSIWFAQILPGPRIHVIDHYRNAGQDIRHYAERVHGFEIVTDGVTGKWSFGQPLKGHSHRSFYHYDKHFVPHDGANKSLAAGGRSIGDQAFAYQINMHVIPATTQVQQIAALRKTLEICSFDIGRCEKGLDALRTYHFKWDPKPRTLSDAPEHDWCLTHDTKVITRYATYRIMDLPQSGEVYTSCGWMPYKSPRITRRNAPLVEVRFSDGLTVRCTPEHKFKTANGWILSRHLQAGTKIQSISTRLLNTSMAASTGCGPVNRISRAAVASYTGMCGQALLAALRQVITFITETMIRSIIDWTIWRSSIRALTPENGRNKALFLHKREPQQQHGIAANQAECGTAEWQSALRVGRNGNARQDIARAAPSLLNALSEAMDTNNCIVRQSVEWRTIASARPLQERCDVWCLTVPGLEEFALENGALVHNSSHDADALEIMGQVWQPNRNDVPKEKPRFLNEATADDVFWPDHGPRTQSSRERI